MLIRSARLPLVAAAALSTMLVAQQQAAPPNAVVERVGDTGFLELRTNSFQQLDVRHQALAYWLTQAAIAIDPIIYDQLSAYGIREKRLLEGIVAHPTGIAPATFGTI